MKYATHFDGPLHSTNSPQELHLQAFAQQPYIPIAFHFTNHNNPFRCAHVFVLFVLLFTLLQLLKVPLYLQLHCNLCSSKERGPITVGDVTASSTHTFSPPEEGLCAGWRSSTDCTAPAFNTFSTGKQIWLSAASA